MKISDILRENDPISYNKVLKMGTERKSGNKSDKLSWHDIKELMSHSIYKRHRGAIKQVR